MHINGVVAQLGERLNGIQEVVSSILSSSTRLKEARVEGRGLFLSPLKGMLSPVSLPAGMALPLFTESRPAFLPRLIEEKV